MMFIASKLAKCGPLWFLGHSQLATFYSSMFQKAPGWSVSLSHELKCKIIRQILSLQWKPHGLHFICKSSYVPTWPFPSLILLLPVFGHTQRKGDHHHSFHLWEVLSLRQGHLTKWSCLSRAFSLLIASKGHTNGHQLPLPQDSSLEISYYYYQGHIHSSFEHPP